MSNYTLVNLVEVNEFRDNQLKSLIKHLDMIDDATEILPFSTPSEISINQKGLTPNSFRLTTAALYQICRALCPGLIKVVADLGAIGISNPERAARPDLAADIYSKTLAARFDQLEDKNFVRNVNKKQIDGIIGSGYKTLSNKEFFDIIQDAMEVLPVTFHEACMIGRSLIVCYRSKTPITTKPDVYHLGYYFTNSEVGDCSVKMASMLLRIKSNERALSLFKKGRMVHIGKTFVSRVRKAMYLAINKPWPVAWATKQLISLPTISLGFKENMPNDQFELKMDKLITKLTRRGLSAQTAERVLYSALYQGKDQVTPKAYEASIKKQLWNERTAYDLFIALIRNAKTRQLSMREAMERLAFDVLANRITVD